MATKQTKDGLGYIIQAITNIIEPKVDTLKYDRTYRAKVVEKIDIGIYKIEINRIVYQLKYDGDLEVGDIVKVKAPLNNFSDIYIETVPSHGGGTGGTSNYNELLNKPILNTNNIVSLPTNSEEIIKGTISLHKIAKTGKYSDLIGTPSIIDNLSSDSTTDALSAKQGRILNGYIKDNDTMITTLQEDIIATEDEINKIKNNYIPISQKGSPNGVATLNSNALLKDTQLPVASKNTLGAIKVGNNLTITNDGILNAVGGSGGVVSDTLPIGSTVEWYSNTIPDNSPLCNGQAVSRTDYPDLFAIIGTTYGEGDGANTFNLPNKKGRFALGLDTEDTDFNTLGKTGGEKTHQLTIEEMPAHDHELNELVAGHGGIRDWALSTAIVSNSGSTFVKAKGGNQPHNNMPPHIVVNYIIKAKQSVGVVATVVDNLDSNSTTDALSAKQGKVLNEKLTALKTYNAEEIDTGEIWIDGKKIYRKVISFNLDNGDTNLIDLSSLNISEIFFDLSKSYYIWSQQNRIIPIISTNVDMEAVSATDVTQKQTGIYYNTSEQILHCEFGNARPIRKGIITIEYTKKTE